MSWYTIGPKWKKRIRRICLWSAFPFIFILGFYLGLKIPYNDLKIPIKYQELIPYQFYHLVILSFTGVFTSLAVVVALFKDDIISWWKKVRFTIYPDIAGFLKEVRKQIEEKQSDEDYIPAQDAPADRYEVILRVLNDGTIHAKDCSFDLQEVTFTSEDYRQPYTFDIAESHTLFWLGSANPHITIHRQDHAKVSIACIKKVGEESTSEAGQSTVPQLFISDIQVSSKDRYRGEWKAKFVIGCSNGRIKHYLVKIKWNGRWANRIYDMKNHITVEELKS